MASSTTTQAPASAPRGESSTSAPPACGTSSMPKGTIWGRLPASHCDGAKVSRADPVVVAAVMAQVEAALAQTRRRPAVIGLCGAQGSGKTTLTRAVLEACAGAGLQAAALSIDDLYLARAARGSEERRVGKEWVRQGRSRWSPYHKKKKQNK